MNKYIFHPLQSKGWGEFREKTGVKVVRGNDFQLTIHKIPHTPFTIGYLPKGNLPDKKLIESLKKIGKENNYIFIQLEPNMEKISNFEFRISNLGLRPAVHPLFTKYNFILDLTKSEEELLKNMHPKTRYNIKVAQKHGVEVLENDSDEAFEEYIKLTNETTKRQNFYAHSEKYHRLMWETLGRQKTPASPSEAGRAENRRQKMDKDKLTAHLLIATYNQSSVSSSIRHPSSVIRPLTLVAWMLFVYKDTLYYPYGASSSEHREVMASNLLMWEAIKFGKKLGLKKFDMWGALGPNPAKTDPWYGFHRFKEGYGGKLVEYVGSYDLVINPLLYQLFKLADKARWLYLKIKSGFR